MATKRPTSKILPESEVAGVEKFASNLENAEFKIVYMKHGIRIDTQMLKSGLSAIRAFAVIEDCVPETMFRMLRDFSFVREYDTVCAEWLLLEEMDPLHSVTYYRIRSPVPLLFKPREFLLTRFHKKYPDRKHIIYGRSIANHPKAPRLGPSKVVRGICTHNFFMMEPEGEDSTRFTYYSQADIRGRIPHFIVNWVTKLQAPKMIITFRKAATKYLVWKALHPDRKKKRKRGSRRAAGQKQAAGAHPESESEGELSVPRDYSSSVGFLAGLACAAFVYIMFGRRKR